MRHLCVLLLLLTPLSGADAPRASVVFDAAEGNYRERDEPGVVRAVGHRRFKACVRAPSGRQLSRPSEELKDDTHFNEYGATEVAKRVVGAIAKNVPGLAAHVALSLPDQGAIERAVMEELRETGTPGAAIGIILDGKLVYARGFGTSNLETGASVRPDMLFRLGSTTKMLTAAAVASLAAEGKLKFDDPVSKYVPNLDPAIGALTLNQLLSHTSGLKDDAVMNGRHDDAALGEEIRAWKSDWLFARPGKIYSYSNPGFWLAGYLAEVIGIAPYATVMERRVFEPLGMLSTTLRPTMAMTRPFSQGHDAGAVLRPAPDNTANWPAGSVFSNVNDLAKFVIALMDGRFGAIATAHSDIPGSSGHYGYGLSLDDVGGVRVWSHGGARAGYGSFLAMVPDRRNALIVLCNRTGESLPRSRSRIAPMIGLPVQAESKDDDRAIAEKDFAKYAGTYRNGDLTVKMAARNGKLMVDEYEVRLQASGGLLLRDAAGKASRRFVAVPGADGQAEFLFAGGRSLARQAQ